MIDGPGFTVLVTCGLRTDTPNWWLRPLRLAQATATGRELFGAFGRPTGAPRVLRLLLSAGWLLGPLSALVDGPLHLIRADVLEAAVSGPHEPWEMRPDVRRGAALHIVGVAPIEPLAAHVADPLGVRPQFDVGHQRSQVGQQHLQNTRCLCAATTPPLSVSSATSLLAPGSTS